MNNKKKSMFKYLSIILLLYSIPSFGYNYDPIPKPTPPKPPKRYNSEFSEYLAIAFVDSFPQITAGCFLTIAGSILTFQGIKKFLDAPSWMEQLVDNNLECNIGLLCENLNPLEKKEFIIETFKKNKMQKEKKGLIMFVMGLFTLFLGIKI